MWPLLALPPPLPPLPPPLPVAREAAPAPPEEQPRRSLEFLLNGGAAALRCDGAAPSSLQQVDPCATRSAPRSLGAAFLWRPWDHWGLGLAATGSWFSWGARGALDEGRGKARWTGAALLARWYPRSDGPWEPYVGHQIGLGWLTMASERGDLTIRREGLVLAAQLGLERWVSSRLRLGLEGEVRWQVTGAAEVCTTACLSIPLARLPDRSLALQATLAVAFGDEL